MAARMSEIAVAVSGVDPSDEPETDNEESPVRDVCELPEDRRDADELDELPESPPPCGLLSAGTPPGKS